MIFWAVSEARFLEIDDISAVTNRDKRFYIHQGVLALDLLELFNRVTRQLFAKITR